jgi:hypothetical protein
MNSNSSPRDPSLLRWGAISGVLGVGTALVQVAINPSYADDPATAIQQASVSHVLTLSRLLDLVAFLLLLCGVTMITRAFSSGRGASWASVARTLYTVSAAAGAIATMVVGSLPDVAAAWAKASPALKPGYIAVYDGLGNASGGVFSVSWAALGGFGIVLAVALRRSGLFSTVVAGISAVSGVALLGAIVVGVGFHVPAAFVLLVLGLLLSYVVVVALALKVWRLAAGQEREPLVAEPVS